MVYSQRIKKRKDPEYSDYEILFELKHAKVEYDSSSNKPFMVLTGNYETGEWEIYSGEDTLEKAKEVAREKNRTYWGIRH